MTNDHIKYRPHLNARQVNKIVELCSNADQTDSAVISLLTTMLPLQLKINHGLIKPAAQTQGRTKLLDNINSISNDGEEDVAAIMADDSLGLLYIHKKFANDLDKLIEVDDGDKPLFIKWRETGELADWNEQTLATRYGFKRDMLTDAELIWAIKNNLLILQEVIVKYPAKQQMLQEFCH